MCSPFLTSHYHLKLVGLVLGFIVLTCNLGYMQAEVPSQPDALFTFTSQTNTARIDFPVTQWQADSQSFHFLYTSQTFFSTFRYSLPTNQLQMVEVIGECGFLFSDDQIEEFAAANCPISRSPNGRYVVYPLQELVCGEACSHLLALGDLQTGEYTSIRKAPDSRNFVRWSRDSSAFLIIDYGQVGGLGGIYHVRIPTDGFPQNEILPTLLENFGIGDVAFVDMSPDGQQVLIRGDGSTNYGLTLWDARLPSTHQQFAAWADGEVIFDGVMVAGASFIPDHPHHLLVVVEQGIVLYDLETAELELVDDSVNAHWVDWTYFSPDARYALAYDNWHGGVESDQLSLFRVEYEALISN